MRDSRKYCLAIAVGALLSVSVATGAQAGNSTSESPRYEPQMVKALAKSLGVSEKAAVERLDRQAQQQSALAGLKKDGVETEGAFFNSKGTLTVNASNGKIAAAIEDSGLNARVPERGQSALGRIKTELDAMATKRTPTGISSWSVDLASDTVTVEVNSDKSAAARAFLKAAKAHGDAVRVVRGHGNVSPQSAIAPGSKMTIGGGPGYCSVGYGAKDSAGTQYLVTAGHCVENLPDLQYDGEHFAKGEKTRFASGTNSVDMGIAKVDSDDSITTEVGTWNSAGDIAVSGSERAAPGADICKSGATTHWTCGKVTSYNVSVTYVDANGGPDTVVTGLGSSSVCTQGGDSGGAYISGNQAQGMTSGGPKTQQCTGEVNSPGSSYFQPLDDALSHYGLTLNTN
ncbi:S1 family peptidase [Streptomyces piniterrae]|uniref:S1 family peptidase n=1 Tax=Streptomyces piniterrae TaxID=2571125 RepID=A0A4U0NJ64_9ACTN|nr:S1 family peptidase [Streptomyces piniterrae]TJZ54321.1 S1 family peptidase [Streptomyces piniterrae]